MEKKKKNKKIIIISTISAVAILAIIGVVVFVLSNAQKLKLYNVTLELGQENYIEELTKEDNAYIKEGYTYSVKDNKIDINNVGTYEVIFEIKGKGETTEEIKKIQVIDTTPPTVELKQDTFYIGDNINVEEIVKIQDLSQEEEIAYSEAKVNIEGQFDTSKEGESQVKISVTDKNGNTGTQELKIKVKNPNVNLYDYIKDKFGDVDTLSLENGEDINIKIKFSSRLAGGLTMKSTTFINFTEKTYKTVFTSTDSFIGNLTTISFIDFDENLNVTKIRKNYGFSNKIENVSLKSDDGKNEIDIYNDEIQTIYDVLKDNNRKINLVGKTIKQLKSETIDLREFQ